MVIFLIVVIIICIVITTILNIRMTLGFTAKLQNKDCSVFITIYSFRNKVIKNLMIYPVPKKNKKPKRKTVNGKRDLKQLRRSLQILRRLFRRSLIIKDFKLHVQQGTGDAFNTAVLYGFIWSAIGMIENLIFTQYKIKNKEIKVDADFNGKYIKINLDCIFSLKIVNIITVGKVIAILYLKNRKGGGAGVKSSNRRSHDYSNAKYQGNG
ncbi:DUF2953 domain-containing protein [Ruminiclostridium cellulolyticum]|uniref:DUF2953 domain-containing protein n=1 Tax=Ruminiclostridium cellulolyticum (strain ATCC 35319 / DSM 5812 / JCM 6584 / H10) TaxID=394503 RepID=B8I2V3_RUMCH|nr:DUF2953 domain-containing protein [Ruminiclostridium cellulolyticum]ACL76096.1 hypothetical protein Ccel_1745 [Ruminiclostridium cellulolyticum H10]